MRRARTVSLSRAYHRAAVSTVVDRRYIAVPYDVDLSVRSMSFIIQPTTVDVMHSHRYRRATSATVNVCAIAIIVVRHHSTVSSIVYIAQSHKLAVASTVLNTVTYHLLQRGSASQRDGYSHSHQSICSIKRITRSIVIRLMTSCHRTTRLLRRTVAR